MNTNAASSSIKLSPAPTPAPVAWQQSLADLALRVRKVFLPHLAVGWVVFIIWAYILYQCVVIPLHVPVLLKSVFTLVLLGGYAAGILGYCLIAASVCALFQMCVYWDGLIDDVLDHVQAKMLSHLDHMQDNLAKDQAKILVRGSIKEVFQSASGSSVPRWVAFVGLGTLMLVIRAVLTARIVKLAGTTVKVSKIFAGKATLAGAIFLNLRLFATLLLVVVYGIGGISLVVNAVLVLGW